ncbi:MAG: MFS transporter [Anaerolineae bacterium]
MSLQQKTELRSIILGYTGFLILGLGGGLLGVAWPAIRAEFGLPLEAQGALTISASLGYSLVSALIGRFAVRFGIRMMFTGMVLIAALGFLGLSAAPVWAVMIIASFLASAGSGGLDAGMNLYAAAHFSPRVMQWLHATWGLGFALTPALYTIVLDNNLSWRVGYAAVMVLYVVLALVIFSMHVWKSVEALATKDGSVKKHTAFAETLRVPLVWISVTLFAVYVGAELMPANWAFSLFTEARQIVPTTATFWVSAYAGGLTVGRIFFGAIASRFTTNQLLRGAMIGALVGIVGLWVGGDSLLSVIGLATTGFCFGPIFPLLMSATPERLGEHAANTIGFQMAAVGIGNALLPAAAGLVAGKLGLETIVPFTFVLGVILFGLHEWMIAQSRKKTEVAA